MVMQKKKVLIVGGGNGGRKLFDLFTGKEWIDVVGVVDPRQDAPAIRAAIEKGVPVSRDYDKYISQAKDEVVIDVTGNPNVSHDLMAKLPESCELVGGTSARLFWYLVDELEKKEADLIQAKQDSDTANKAKSEFLSNMSHELRTPLNAVLGFSELLLQESFGPLIEKQKEYVKDIYDSGKHLLSLINDVLDLSKIEAGKMELILTQFDAPGFIGNCIALLREKAVKHDLKINLNIEDGIGAIKADERKVKQVLFNLLSNAVKFTPDGGQIDIQVSMESSDKMKFSVTDTGIGIKPEDRKKVFKSFSQIDNSRTRHYAGTGLGLALSKKIVELHGGEIFFESAGENKGTSFTFTIRLREIDQG